MKRLLLGLSIISIISLPSCKSHRNKTSTNFSKNEHIKFEEQLGITLPENTNVEFLKAIIPWLGAPYKYGGTSIIGTDCSGFITSIYSSFFNKELERTSLLIYQKAKKINKSEVKEGDLVFLLRMEKKSHMLE